MCGLNDVKWPTTAAGGVDSYNTALTLRSGLDIFVVYRHAGAN